MNAVGEEITDHSTHRPRPARLLLACGALTGATALTLVVVGWIGYARHGLSGLEAAAVAALVCWSGSLAALLLAVWGGAPKQAVARVLAGMIFRMGVPLVVGLVLHRRGGALSEAGVFGMILAFYFVTLTVETWLSVRLLAPATRRPNMTEVV
jgi:hypothetical protein